VNRRDLLLLRTDPDRRVAELSCERLYMQYQFARLTMDCATQPPESEVGEQWDDEPPAVFGERTTQQLFGEVERGLRNADVVRVIKTEWLAVDAFRRDVEELLSVFRGRGGRVEYQPDTRSTATGSGCRAGTVTP
jgi:hypothetical protein